MVIEISYENPYDHVPEAESNNRVIKNMFRISYYRFSYKNIPRVIICHLVMNVTQNLNVFPTKLVVSYHYSPHMIIPQSN